MEGGSWSLRAVDFPFKDDELMAPEEAQLTGSALLVLRRAGRLLVLLRR